MTGIQIRSKGTTTALVMMSIAGMLGSLKAAEPAAPGKDLFARRCSGCHALDSEKSGPRLRGVLNRKAGTLATFLYSDALRTSGITWDEQALSRWLENPTAVVKDTDMEFRVTNADERAAIIAYLRTVSK
jgi:cytochrome c